MHQQRTSFEAHACTAKDIVALRANLGSTQLLTRDRVLLGLEGRRAAKTMQISRRKTPHAIHPLLGMGALRRGPTSRTAANRRGTPTGSKTSCRSPYECNKFLCLTGRPRSNQCVREASRRSMWRTTQKVGEGRPAGGLNRRAHFSQIQGICPAKQARLGATRKARERATILPQRLHARAARIAPHAHASRRRRWCRNGKTWAWWMKAGDGHDATT